MCQFHSLVTEYTYGLALEGDITVTKSVSFVLAAREGFIMLVNKYSTFLLIAIAILLMPFTVIADFGNEKLLLALDGAENDFFRPVCIH